MLKDQYLKELKTQTGLIKRGSKNKSDVRKVQEWLNLWRRYNTDWNISVAIDGDFGLHTEAVLREFQRFRNLESDGIVGSITWQELSEPMRLAFSPIDEGLELNDLVVAYARQHLKSQPREFKQNRGTWVRAYMDGHEGRKWPWCMGFVQTIIDQATFTLGQQLTDFMPKSYSCDVVGNHGLKKQVLVRNSDLRTDPTQIQPGDVFLNVKPEFDWTHTGIVSGINGDWIETIEGNTNDEGSREGYEVCARRRNFTTKNIDIFRIVEQSNVEPDLV